LRQPRRRDARADCLALNIMPRRVHVDEAVGVVAGLALDNASGGRNARLWAEADPPSPTRTPGDWLSTAMMSLYLVIDQNAP